MSVDAPSKTKEKKAKRDAERHGKGRKRKHGETLDVPESAEETAESTAPEFISLDAGNDVVQDAPAVKAPKAKKRKQAEGTVGATAETPAAAPVKADAPADDDEAAAAKRKARTHARNLRKRNKEKLLKGRQPADEADPSARAATAEPASGEEKSKSRFILFIGNLPFSTTDTALEAHFKRLQPFTLRHRTDPATKKSKGFAFLEFENYDRMETCLKKYHHTLFDPDDYREEVGKFGASSGQQAKRNKGKAKGRLINVELTAGGGGKGTERMKKIVDKNTHLEEERARRAEQEMAEANKGGGNDKKVAAGRKQQVLSDANAEGVHPSRLAMLKA